MRLKTTVSTLGAKPEIVIAMMIACEVYREFGLDMVGTSLTDGKHGAHSHHLKGMAVDLGVTGMTAQQRQDCAAEITARLSAQYQVIDEGDHIHLEFDPA
jgi:hypothetical protein